MKKNKGITLVALIITIIVLLILAVVTISAVNEGSLFAHANNAATLYQERQEEENTIIAGYLSKLKEHDGGEDTPTGNEVWYDITFNNLTKSDWSNINLQAGSLYIIGLINDDSNNPLSMIAFRITEGEEPNYAMIAYLPNVNNSGAQYVYDYDNGVWNYYTNYLTADPEIISSTSQLEVSKVKIMPLEEITPYLVNGNADGLPYESIVITKTVSQE